MDNNREEKDKLVLLASRTFAGYSDMYKVVDFVNKNIKDKGVMLGLTKESDTERVSINIYQF